MKPIFGPIIAGIALIALIVIAACGPVPDFLTLKPIAKQSFLGTLSWLFVVALFIERAVEVIVSVLRDAGAAPLEHACETAQVTADTQAKLTPTALPNLKPLHDAQSALFAYRTETKELALCVSFVLGLFVSLAGVRAFGMIVEKIPANDWLFTTADMVVTGAILAGGTDAIHKMMNVFTNFVDNAADKAKGS